MIGNRLNVRLTHKHKGLLDGKCMQNNDSVAWDTWEIKLVPQLNHDLSVSQVN